MNKIVKVESTTLRVNNSGDAKRKYNLSADARLNDSGVVSEVNNGSIMALDGHWLGGFGTPSGTGFSMNINDGTTDRAEVFDEINHFIEAIKEGGEV